MKNRNGIEILRPNSNPRTIRQNLSITKKLVQSVHSSGGTGGLAPQLTPRIATSAYSKANRKT